MKKIFFAGFLLVLTSFSLQQVTVFQQLHALVGGTWTMKTSKGALCEQWQ